MNFKQIAAACGALCTSAAFAAPVLCDTTTAANLTNTCAPEVTFYAAGASAQAGALNSLLASGGGIFDTNMTRGKITLVSSSISGTGGNTVGYIGFGAAGTSYAGKRVLVIYNKANGSAAGVLQLLSGKTGGNGEEVTLFTANAAQLKAGTPGTCTGPATEPSAGTLVSLTCSTEANFLKGTLGLDKQKTVHLALSDVRPNELDPGFSAEKKLKWKADKFPSETTGVQGFGVIVNNALYTALIDKNIADGVLPSSCAGQTIGNATDTITGTCQPSISRADMTSIVAGKITSPSALLGSFGDNSKTLTLQRRVASSGTQAANQIFFAGQSGFNAKTPLVDGFLDVAKAGTTGQFTVVENDGTSNVINGVSGELTNYALGVVSLENTYSLTKSASKLKGAGFVKIDGFSPNFNGDLLDPKARFGMTIGYPFAYDMQAVKNTALAGDYLDIYTKIVAALKDPARDLPGIAYIGSSDAAKNTPFTHSGNNYLPLSK